jgi:hypothetical protein
VARVDFNGPWVPGQYGDGGLLIGLAEHMTGLAGDPYGWAGTTVLCDDLESLSCLGVIENVVEGRSGAAILHVRVDYSTIVDYDEVQG